MRQFLEAEKKIRIQTLIKFGHLSFKEACKVLTSAKISEDTKEEAAKLLQELSFDFGTEWNVGDEEGILFFFAGYLARAESKLLKCESCLSLFVLSKTPPDILLDDNLGDSKRKFLDQINRGGLFTPTDALYILVLHGRQLYKEVMNGREFEKKFLGLQNQQSIFTAMFEMKITNDTNAAAILEQSCEHSHKFSERIHSISDRIFNTFSKNFTAEINDKINQERSRKRKKKVDSKNSSDSAARKVAKLNGQSGE